MRVLYVEDNEVNQALVARVMRARQNKVLFCEEGERALEILAEDAGIELVLLDIELAGALSGIDVVRTLRARNDHRPVVAITAYAMMGDRERILEAGCDQYLPKPLVIPDLLKLLDHYDEVLAAAASAKPAAAASVEAARAEAAPAAAVPTEATPVEATPVETPPADAAPAVVPVASAPTAEPAASAVETPATASEVAPTEPAAATVPEAQEAQATVADQAPVTAATQPSSPTPVSSSAPAAETPVTIPPVDPTVVEPVEEKQHEQG